MAEGLVFPKNPDEVRQWLNSIPLYQENLSKNTAFFSHEMIRDLQNANLAKQMVRLEKFSPFYRDKFKEWGVDPRSIKTVDDLEHIPLTSKSDYMQSMGESFKLDKDWANILDHISYEMTYTTGTSTGMPSCFYNTTYDMFMLSHVFQQGCQICYLEPNDVIMNLFPFHFIPHIGFYRSWHFAAAVGMTLCFGFNGSPLPGFEHTIHRSMQRTLEDIQNKKVNALSGVGSYIRRLVMKAEEQGLDFSRINKIQALGEPCPKGMRDDIRRRLQKMGAGEVFISNAFGFTEAQIAFQECCELGGVHTGVPELYYVEAVDAETGKRKPDGEPGLLAITHLDRRGTCLLRYLVGDIVAVTNETCPICGRNDTRLIPAVGSTYSTRTKELLKVKGTLINPQIMFDAVANTEGIIEYQFEVTKEVEDDPYSMDMLLLKVGVEQGVDKERIEKELVAKIQRAVELRPKVLFVDISDIFNPGQTLKATRIVDKHPLH